MSRPILFRAIPIENPGRGIAPALQTHMAKFLTTNGINYLVEEIIKGARERIVLVSPYLKLNSRIKELLGDGYRPDIDMRIVYGKKELDAPERQWLRSVPHIRTSFCQNLHAKCYLNESICVITSLNLHLYSQQNNNEMGVMVKRSTDHQMFSDITAEVDRLLRISESTHQDRENLVLERPSAARTREDSPEYTELTTSRLAAKLGLQTRVLVDKLIGNGFLYLKDGRKHLTDAGKSAGGHQEFSSKKGQFILWPANLRI
jgi:phosphatidylserine/phosphatidylglycerophosphate/cardiolipin synthase-like enzyme